MAALNVHPVIVQQALGHSSITETLGVYSHASESMSRQATAAIDAALSASRASDVQRE